MNYSEIKFRFRFLGGAGMFWAGYWTALFIVTLEQHLPWWESLLCAVFSAYNLHHHWRSVDKIVEEMNEVGR